METTFLVIFALFLFNQTYGASSSNIMITASSNVTCIQRERKSLVVFRQGLKDESNRLSTWTGVECCEWQGVGCDRRNGHVVKLDLRSPLPFMDDYTLNTSNWLKGKVSPSLRHLKHLRYLDLSMNNFSGQNIPEFFGSFKYLEYLNLSNSGFSGVVPPHLGNLSRLQYLDLNLLYRYDMVSLPYNVSLMVKDDLRWVSLLSSLKHLDFSGITIGNHIDWFHPVNMLPSLLTLNLASCDINISSIKFINFTSLNSLDLSSNRINSTIPVWLSNLTGLVHLNLKVNYFRGRISDSIGTLSSLVRLDLSSNQFHGPIPPSLGGLSSLRVLSLYNNQLNESIPESIGLLTWLERLYLSNNQLSGSIPASIGTLSSLSSIDLSSNILSGPIPPSLDGLSSLRVLSLYSNKLNGSIPESIGLLTRLQGLYLDGNQLSGNIPTSFGQLSNLQYIYLCGNQLSGSIPESIGLLTRLQVLDLKGNQLSGVVSEIHFAKLYNLTRLDLSYNQIRGRPPTMSPGLDIVNLGKNRFTGSVPTHLCNLLSIKLLDLSDNNFSGVLPKCLGNLIQLRVMDLANNTITGDVPNSLGSLSNIQSLHLQNNKFEGNLSVALQNLTSLVTFDLGNNLLTGNIPSWIGKKLSKLKIMNLQSNKFMGKIPLELCQNNALQYLNLANNSIIGMIPHCFCNLTGMIMSGANFTYEDGMIMSGVNFTYKDGLDTEYYENIEAYIKGSHLKYTTTTGFLIFLDLSSNKIIGEIPDVLMNLVALKNLNLSRNLLSGQIPATIGNLKQVESLDLSMNKLSGRIPQSLTSLDFLSYLNLSFNNLAGPIPVGNHLQTLGDPSTIYEGNTELCGPSLSRSCKENNLSYAHAGEDEGKDGSQGCSWIYAGMVPGFVVGFMGLIGSLHFIRIWRVTYFEMIENVYAFLKISIIGTLARLRRKIF